MSKTQFFSQLEPLFGFQGVGAAIYTGASPNTTGVFTEFILQENKIVTSSRFLRTLLRLTDKLPTDYLCASTRNLLFRMSRKKGYGISNVIPFQLLRHFSPKLKEEFTKENILQSIPTIFDTVRKNKLSYKLQKPAPRSEISVFKDLINRIERGEFPDLMVIHLCSLDIIGHNFGPDSPHTKHTLKNIDEEMHKTICAVESSLEKLVAIIFSDHGMSPISKCVNLLGMLNSSSLRLGKDYLVFLDSTIARFWFFNDKAKKTVFQKLSTLDCGKILDKSDMKKLGIDKIGQEYGELFFALNDGYVIHPDFFRKHSPPKGMHGYAFPSDSPILFTCAPNQVNLERRKTTRFIDIAPTVLDLLELPPSPTCEGKSLLK